MNAKHIKKNKLQTVTNLLIVSSWVCILIQVLCILRRLKSIRKFSTLLKIIKIIN